MVGWSDVLEGIVLLHVWWHPGVLWRQRVLLDLLSIVFLILVIVIISTFVFEVVGSFVLMRLAILSAVSSIQTGGPTRLHNCIFSAFH